MTAAALPKHPRRLLVLIAEAAIERDLVQDVKRLGAHGYTVSEVRGGGMGGDRDGDWEADLTVRMEVVCDAAVADAIAAHVMARYAPHYGLTLYFADVDVLRPQKF